MENPFEKQPIELPEEKGEMELESTRHEGTPEKMAVESREAEQERMEKEADAYAKTEAMKARSASEYQALYKEAYGKKKTELERGMAKRGKFAEEIGELPPEALEPIEEEKRAA
jgi:hypothetical protein